MAKRDDNKAGHAAKTYFRRRLLKHLKADPAELDVVEQTFPTYHRPNLHLAIEQLLSAEGAAFDLDGIVLPDEHHSVSLSKLTRDATARRLLPGPVEYFDAPVAVDCSVACVKRGLYRVRAPAGPFALLVNETRWPAQLAVEVMAADRERARDVARKLAALVHRGGAYRGQVLTLEQRCEGTLGVHFRRLPRIDREQVVLPEAVQRRLDRQALAFTRHADRLRAAGRHLKRGLLLHGPPGTGKTLSAMYLASQMPGRTVLILTGGGLNAIEATGEFARALAPVTVILEDVDLIGTRREEQTVGANALLFELLNQMDGLAEDADVLFVLTTNRPDVLEPALASRPGRIDQAIEVPLPDADCRRRLLALYSRGLDVRLTDLESLVAATEGASAAFIRELLRKAALLAAEQPAEAEGEAEGESGANPAALAVGDTHLAEALEELTLAGGPLTRRLLGAETPPALCANGGNGGSKSSAL